MSSTDQKIKAFTLIELLVVIAIIGILSGLIVVSMSGATNSANDARRKENIDALRKALIYTGVSSGGTYPVAAECNIGPVGTPSRCANLDSLLEMIPNFPVDPVSGYYTYVSNGSDFTVSAVLSNSTIYSYTKSVGFGSGVPFACGTSTVTFTYRGGSVTYGTVLSPSGKCFLDRNLGASRVATAYNDSSAYGDYFQWGRLDDNHQASNSATTSTLSTTDVPGHANFIIAGAAPSDWRSGQNNSLWQGVNGTNNPCPSGWRIPTSTEWAAEITAGSWTNYNSAYASPLKLTAGGWKAYSLGTLVQQGNYADYWSSTINGTNAYNLYLTATNAYSNGNNQRATGFLVRCLKN